jgi:PAS domain S-box-containing protein
MGQWLCLGGALLGALGLAGSLTGSTWLTTLIPGMPPMTPNTALGLVLAGGAGALRQREGAGWLRQGVILLAALAVLTIGGGTLIEYARHVDLGIDQWLIRGQAGPYPGRPSPPTALALTLLAAALLLYDTRPDARLRPSEALLLSAAFIAFLALLGQLFDAGLLYRMRRTPTIGVALPTASGLLLVSLGLLLGRPTRGLMRLVTSATPGGMLLRRLLGPAILAPAVSGLTIGWLYRTFGLADAALLLSTLAAVTTLVSLVLLALTAGKLNQASQALEVSQARTRELVEHAPDGIFLADLQGRYTEVNTAGCQMLGYARQQLIGKTIMDLIPPGDVERLWASRDQMLQGRTHVAEWTLRRQDGGELPVEVSARILPDGRWQGFVRDITERKRVEEVLRRRQAEQTFLAEVGPALAATLEYQDVLTTITQLGARNLADFCLVDVFAADGEEGQIKVASRDPAQAWIGEQLERLPGDEDLARSWWSGEAPLVPRLLQPTELVAWLSRGEAQLRALQAAGAQSIIAAPLVARGKLLGALALLSSPPSRNLGPEDVRLAEELARRAALAIDNARLYREAKAAVRLRDELLTVASHELNTPIASLKLMSQSFEKLDVMPPAAEFRRMVGVISRQSQRLAALVSDILDVGEIPAGSFILSREPVELASLVTETVELARHDLDRARCRLTLRTGEQLVGHWDRARIRKVIASLLSNAIKFAPGKQIEVVVASGDPGWARLIVEDHGMGIPPERLPHIFGRFERAVSVSHYGGLGLGLYIVRALVEAHGGRVTASSAPGEGAKFTVDLPLAPH